MSLVNTENTFLEAMEFVQLVFVDGLAGTLTPLQHEALFGNLAAGVLPVHRAIRDKLVAQQYSNREYMADNVRGVFADAIPELRQAYRAYLANLPAAQQMLQALQSSVSKASVYIQAAMALPRARRSDLWVLLNMPKARLAKYYVLLGAIHQHRCVVAQSNPNLPPKYQDDLGPTLDAFSALLSELGLDAATATAGSGNGSAGDVDYDGGGRSHDSSRRGSAIVQADFRLAEGVDPDVAAAAAAANGGLDGGDDLAGSMSGSTPAGSVELESKERRNLTKALEVARRLLKEMEVDLDQYPPGETIPPAKRKAYKEKVDEIKMIERALEGRTPLLKSNSTSTASGRRSPSQRRSKKLSSSLPKKSPSSQHVLESQLSTPL